MNARTNPEIILQKEHKAREAQRCTTYLVNVVLAALIVGVTIVAQLPQKEL